MSPEQQVKLDLLPALRARLAREDVGNSLPPRRGNCFPTFAQRRFGHALAGIPR
jgi:hypothetical protein